MTDIESPFIAFFVYSLNSVEKTCQVWFGQVCLPTLFEKIPFFANGEQIKHVKK